MEQLGVRRFAANKMKHFKSRGNKLVCAQCEKATSDRLAKLARLVRQSKVKCTCKNPIHTEKCLLYPLSAGQARWPGMDTGVSKDDVAFLKQQKAFLVESPH